MPIKIETLMCKSTLECKMSVKINASVVVISRRLFPQAGQGCVDFRSLDRVSVYIFSG